MKFHFDFDIKKLPQPITHKNRLLLIGSCFTENIGAKLKTYKFSVLENPNGILFNPVSVAEALITYIDNAQLNGANLFQFNEGWHSWKHHSRFSGLSAEEALNKINTSTTIAHNYLKEADYLMITLGSSWIYTLTEKASNAKPGSVAANNHKAPADWFYRRLMSTEEVLEVLDNTLFRLFHFNPKLKIIFTISPVRHLREGVVENNRSKAVLIQAVHQLVDKFEGLYYFPAYELVIDDLRDYRFYAEDLVHPNYFATQYVWEKFVDACIHEQTKTLMKEIHLINLAYQHKPFNEKTEAHEAFKLKYLEKAKQIQQQFPFLDLKKEIEHFSL
jgi:GSCFA family